jgi:hypothetical protein
MTKVTGPMLSVTLSGTYGGCIQFMKFRESPYRKDEEKSGIGYVRVHRLSPEKVKPDLFSIQDTLAAGVSIWQAEDSMSAETRNSWASAASGLAESGFNRYIQCFIENNPQRQPPWNVPSP